MGLLDRLKAGLQKTQSKLAHEIRRIVTRSPKLTGSSLEELEAALIGADFGATMSREIAQAVRIAFEGQGRAGLDLFAVAEREVVKGLGEGSLTLAKQASGPTVISIIGVNGTGKTTTAAKLAHLLVARKETAMLAACDTFRAAAIEQLKLWGDRLKLPVVAGAYGADPSSVAHDAAVAATARKLDYLLVDTAGRLHTKQNLMQELQKLHRVLAKQVPGAPHETLLVLDATTGANALTQARVFHQAVPLTGLVVTKLDGRSKGGMIVAVRKELGIPVKFIGVGEQPDDLQPFDPKAFAHALFAE